MMQTILAIGIVAAAAAWLLRRFYFTIRAAYRGESDKLGSCGTCSRNPSNEKTPVIQLGSRRSGSQSRADAP